MSISLGVFVAKVCDGKDVSPEGCKIVGLGIMDGLKDFPSIDVKVGLVDGTTVAGAAIGSNVVDLKCEGDFSLGADDFGDIDGVIVGSEDGSTDNTSRREGFKEGSSLSTSDPDGAIDIKGLTLLSAEGSMECIAEGFPLGEPVFDGAIDIVGSNEIEGTLDIDG